MNELTLWSVNWNQQKALELMLQTYAKNHFDGERLNLLLVDNGSTDGSKDWLRASGVPFISLARNVGHERALQFTFNMINTNYVLLCDSDIKFKDSVVSYLKEMREDIVSIGEVIEGEKYGETELKPRVAPWFQFIDMDRIKQAGIDCWRGTDAWHYDVGSWFLEQISKRGLRNFRLPRPNREKLGTDYGKYFHFSQVSTDSEKHGVTEELSLRRNTIYDEVRDMEKIDLSEVFKGPSEEWDNEKIDREIEKGWNPL